MDGLESFRPAKPWAWVIWVVQTFLRFNLPWRNRLHIEVRGLEALRGLPQGNGLILVANHADDSDIKECMELSRRCKRPFIYMVNREAFDEGFGIAGWWLQHLGAFSVDRGGINLEAKHFAIDVVKRGEQALVVFPEGDVFFMNDLVQSFKSGAVEIGMQAATEVCRTRPDWKAFIVPMAIRYRFKGSIARILERRTHAMEQRLNIQMLGLSLQRRLTQIMAVLLRRQEQAHHLTPVADRLTQLGERVQEVRRAILSDAETRYAVGSQNPAAPTMDRAWRLSSHLRTLLARRTPADRNKRTQVRTDLASAEDVAHMGGWQPSYTELNPSQERLAEMVMKLERDVYATNRPRRLAKRDVFIRIGEPLDLSDSIAEYQQDPHGVRKILAAQLRDAIQKLLDLPPTI